MSDFPNSTGDAGSVRYIDPDSLNKNPAFTNVVVELAFQTPRQVNTIGTCRRHCLG